MAKAWFYLTLWRGTPPEFTEEVEADIQAVSDAPAVIATASRAESQIETATAATTEIVTGRNAEVEIITRTEVVWLVGN